LRGLVQVLLVGSILQDIERSSPSSTSGVNITRH
jgi:hypothetical protein